MQILSNGLSKYLDNLLESSKTESNKNLIKVESTGREGHYLMLTKRRAEILEKQLALDKYSNGIYPEVFPWLV